LLIAAATNVKRQLHCNCNWYDYAQLVTANWKPTTPSCRHLSLAFGKKI